MRRSTLNLAIDAVSLLAFLAMVATGFLLRLILPPGSRGGRGLGLWGLTRHEWGDIHFWLAIALIGLLLFHLVLHWSWVWQVVRGVLHRPATSTPNSRSLVRLEAGFGALAVCVALVLGFLYMASANVTGREGAGPARDDNVMSGADDETTSTPNREPSPRRHRRGASGRP